VASIFAGLNHIILLGYVLLQNNANFYKSITAPALNNAM